MADLNDLTAQEIGRRLRLARENVKIRQDEAAKVIGMSRPTLVSIEKGDRRVRIQELQALANHYGVSVNALLRREAVHTDLVPRFRRLRETEEDHTGEAVKLLNDLVKAEVELENILGIERPKNYPPERGINDGDVIELAESHAQGLRDWLGLGSGPIADIFTLMELDLGIRLYQRRLSSKSKVAGLFTFDQNLGACILLNANHPWERRVQSAAHELGHFIGTRQAPEVLEENEQFLSREERYANAFGRAFLTPRKSFEQAFRQLIAGSDSLTRRHVILLAHQHNISREACVRRLEELGLVKKGIWAWFEANGGITNAQARDVLGNAATKADPIKDDADQPVSHRMGLMAYAAWKRELMSEGQLAELLNIRRLDLRALLDQFELEESETDDLFKLPR
ncbi:helix-turn-helix domain-containing protein [Thalassospira indica]|uniref:ImmA/IrrE family metallo-endopeptidase n=1 Tax=Thalassospira indica TaxID=1891279 RepID=A0ABN5NKL3_9PROT|nr:XRE family transcriptional regulator [Thalassospira indica]AXO16500.1 ImmA/IrrE family metallo-endopeptidase [Thalassospira indica]OAZ10658.1 transcriptional regulator [Thalassospira profundimaris]